MVVVEGGGGGEVGDRSLTVDQLIREECGGWVGRWWLVLPVK